MLSLMLIACGPTADTITVGLTSANPVVREDMVKIARNVDDEAVVDALVKVLADPSAAIRTEAVNSLAALDAVEAVPHLIPLLQDAEPAVARQVVDALGQLGEPAAVEPLVAYLDAHADVDGRDFPLNALWALGNIGDPTAVEALSSMREHADTYVAFNANQALKKISGQGA